MKTSLSQSKRIDRWKRARHVIIIFALLVTLLDFAIFQKLTFRLSLVNVIGSSLFILGVSIRIAAIRTLGKYFLSDLTTLRNHRLIKHGIYKHIRHPAYLGSILFAIGIPLTFSSLYGFLLMLCFIPCYIYRIKLEENMLLERFGKDYLKYMKKTKKIIPFLY